MARRREGAEQGRQRLADQSWGWAKQRSHCYVQGQYGTIGRQGSVWSG